MAKRKNHKPTRKTSGVPSDARYVNVTTLDDDLLVRVCRLSESKLVNNAYLVVGILALAIAAVAYVFLHADLFTTVILVAFGILFLFQRTQLSKRAAKHFGKELDRSGEGGRTRTTYFTTTDVGTVDDDGSLHTFPYSAIERVFEDERMYALILRQDAGIVAIAKSGFTRGNAGDFGESIRRHVEQAGAAFQAEIRPRKKGVQ